MRRSGVRIPLPPQLSRCEIVNSRGESSRVRPVARLFIIGLAKVCNSFSMPEFLYYETKSVPSCPYSPNAATVFAHSLGPNVFDIVSQAACHSPDSLSRAGFRGRSEEQDL